MIRIQRAESAADLEQIRELIREYWGGLGAQVCFQDLQAELDGLPGEYAPPVGELLLGEVDGAAAGCVALRRLDEDACEMKRLYMRDRFRAKGLGGELVLAILSSARELGYKIVRLDTLPSMKGAQRLYESLGFYDIPAYAEKSVPGRRNMELRLDS